MEEAKEKKGLIKEFKEFISRGNVLDMAIGVIIATAFGKITTSLVNDVILPFIGWICGGMGAVEALNITIAPAVINEAGEVVKEATVIGFGTFVSTIIDFLIVAFVVFCIVKAFNKARDLAEHKKREAEAAAKAAEEAAKAEEPPAPTTEELLAQILEELKAKK